MAKTIIEFVSDYCNEHGRGCPKGVLVHVGGYKAKDIAHALTSGILESGRGSEGGIFVAGEKPSPRTVHSVSLKSRMADYLRTLTNDAAAVNLVAEYDAELKRRADAQE